MSRTLILFVIALALVGCGNDAAVTNNADGAKNIDSVTFDKPTEEKIGSISMKSLCEKAGIKPYPGSDVATGDSYKRGDGGYKDDVKFTTEDSVDKVAAHFKEQGLDTKVLSTEASSMGPTKAGANVIVSMIRSGKETQVTIKSVHYDKPAGK